MAAVYRLLLCGSVGLFVGGAVGFGLSMLFISTPLSNVLGPRYSEFDVFGVLGVSIVAAIVACPISAVIALLSVSSFLARIWTVIIGVVLLGIGSLILWFDIPVEGEWAWTGLTHVSVCLGVLAAVWVSAFAAQSQRESDEQDRAQDI